MKKARKYMLALQTIATVFLLISTTTAIKFENLEESEDPYEQNHRSGPIRKNGIVLCYLGLFIPPDDTVPLRTDVEIKSIDGIIHRYLPAFMGLLGLKFIFGLPADKEYIVTAEWQGQIKTEHVYSFNQLGIARVYLIFQEEGP